MDGDGCVQMSFLCWEHQRYLILDNNCLYMHAFIPSYFIDTHRLALRINKSNLYGKGLSFLGFV
jgi:hypothetical protein